MLVGTSSKRNPYLLHYVAAEGYRFENSTTWGRGTKKGSKLRIGHGHKKRRQPRNETPPLTRRGPAATSSEERRSVEGATGRDASVVSFILCIYARYSYSMT